MCGVKMNFMNEDCEIDFDEILQETIVDVSVGQKIPENAAIIFTQEDYFPVKGIHTRIHSWKQNKKLYNFYGTFVILISQSSLFWKKALIIQS